LFMKPETYRYRQPTADGSILHAEGACSEFSQSNHHLNCSID
jgi:hypothetical protein